MCFFFSIETVIIIYTYTYSITNGKLIHMYKYSTGTVYVVIVRNYTYSTCIQNYYSMVCTVFNQLYIGVVRLKVRICVAALLNTYVCSTS